MRARVTGKSGHGRLISHLLLAAVLVGCAVVLLHWPSLTRTVGAVVGAAFAVHAGVAIVVHVVIALAGAGVVVAAVRSHGRGHRHDGEGPGATLHAPRFYDWLAAVYCLGREGKMRGRTLDVAGVAAGERVLDVCCGTGTLALAAKGRVGVTGSVNGIDASEQMVARARSKAARRGLPVTFEIASAQSLPFPEATFDVAICSLALHHLPDDARAGAIVEMRRVLKPGGRVLIVEFARARGAWALLHPLALLHHRKAQILDAAATLMEQAGLEGVVSGPLGFAGLGYARAHRTSKR
jgi:ubiquinone/menaquinone biosynthesis C-methylase UbiE